MTRALLFTGHMVDLPGRDEPRFPQALVSAAADSIGDKLEPFTSAAHVRGFASCARGGDVLFHEECRSRRIETTVVLPFAPKKFIETSVEGVPGTDWVSRFWRIWNETPEERREVLGLPVAGSAYGECNSRLLDLARAHGNVHLIVIWDGKGGDGPGGTADLVTKAKKGGDDPDMISPASIKPGDLGSITQ